MNVSPHETRVAVVEDGVLQEVLLERHQARGLVGNIYKGKVARVLPGMGAAFIEIGMQRTGFLHVADIVWQHEEQSGRDASDAPPITRLLHDGQTVLVQVLKDPIGTKGPRLTTRISIASRYLVYLPECRHMGVSQRIEDEADRVRLKETLERLVEEHQVSGGFIVRTVADMATEEELVTEIRFLRKIWDRACEARRAVTAPGLIYEDLPLSRRTMRDLLRDSVEKVRIDSREAHAEALSFVRDFIPEAVDRIEHYLGERPIFDLFSVEDEIERALDRKVLLKSGGYLIVDQTEAMTTIDVNTGAYTGRRNLEETLYKTNLEAAHAIARQLRLRNCGGIIIIDFIDMQDAGHRRAIIRALEQAVSKDRVKTVVTEMSPLGLVEVTRKRTRESLERVMCEPCPVCRGRGIQKTALTVCYEIFREILRDFRQYETREYTLIASQAVIDRLLDEEATALADLQAFIDRPIHLQVDAGFHQEQYDIVLM